jgi:hypothetical protein
MHACDIYLFFWYACNIAPALVLKILPVVNGLTAARMIWPGTTGNRLGPARSTSWAVFGLGRQPVGQAQHDPFSSVRSDLVVGPFSLTRHDTTRKLK